MHTQETIDLQLKALLQEAKRGYCLRKLIHNIVAVTQICDSGCKVIFDQDEVAVIKDNVELIKGWCNALTQLCRISIVGKTTNQPPPPPKVNEEYVNVAVQLNTADYTVCMANS
eukprot:10526882-Ditylum_brightwellii.AAC.1